MIDVSGYTIHRELRFKVCNQEFAVGFKYPDDRTVLLISEVRGYNQACCRMFGELSYQNGHWDWSVGEPYYNRLANVVENSIAAYLNTHPIPWERFYL